MLARKMGIVKLQVDRLFDWQHSSRVEQLKMVFAALEKSLTIFAEDAACSGPGANSNLHREVGLAGTFSLIPSAGKWGDITAARPCGNSLLLM